MDMDYPTMDEARAATAKAEELAQMVLLNNDEESLRAAAEAARLAKRSWDG